MIRITLVCTGGMSTSLLMNKIIAAAKKENVEIHAEATSESNVKDYLDKTDVLLLGPQVGYMQNKFFKLAEGRNIKVEVINGVDYGTMNGENVLKRVLDLMQ